MKIMLHSAFRYRLDSCRPSGESWFIAKAAISPWLAQEKTRIMLFLGWRLSLLGTGQGPRLGN